MIQIPQREVFTWQIGCTECCTKRWAREAHARCVAIGSSHRPQKAVTSRYDLKAPGRGLGGGTPASEVSTIVREAHAIYDAQPRRRDFFLGQDFLVIQLFLRWFVFSLVPPRPGADSCRLLYGKRPRREATFLVSKQHR